MGWVVMMVVVVEKGTGIELYRLRLTSTGLTTSELWSSLPSSSLPNGDGRADIVQALTTILLLVTLTLIRLCRGFKSGASGAYDPLLTAEPRREDSG